MGDLVLALSMCVVLVGVGVAISGVYHDLAFVVRRDDLASGIFALAGVMGTMAGFVAAVMVFLGTSGLAVERMRRQVGVRLPNALAFSVFILFLAAVATAICGVFADGWVARGIVVGSVLTSLGVVAMVTFTIWAAFYRDIRDEGISDEDRTESV
ncbi:MULTISPECIES: hypothetical protein [unclassified Dietzia]|uniref:hypothetical protein n=1 Tax=unclassified Dietzia TaxID=2617939 RepID=UPI0012E8A22D|nr:MULTISPECIES: hypothetical protein [unclassified Dietzia]